MSLYPPSIRNSPFANFGKKLRGVRIKEPGHAAPAAPGWDTNPNTGLWAYVPFESKDNVADVINSDHDWSLDGLIASFDDIAGKNNTALRLASVESPDGASCRLIQQFADDDWEFDGSAGTLLDFTIRLWFYPTAGLPAAGETIPLITHRYTKGWALTVGDTNLSFIVYGETGGADTTQIDIANAGITLAAWNYVVATYDSVAQQIGLQLNGGVMQTAAHTAGIMADPVEDVNIGTYYNISTGYAPSIQFGIDELAVWSRVLSANDIAHDYNSGNGKFYPNLA